MDVILRTPRLTLRPQGEADIDANLAGLNDYEVVRFLTVVPYPYTLADARSWIGSLRPNAVGHAVFAIDLPGHGMIGAVTLLGDLGYWLDRRYHGHGYMTEASAALLDWHFAARPDDVVRSGLHLGNTASWGVQKKLGFVDTGRREMKFCRSQNREVEHMATTLTRADFEMARPRQRST
ncbi:MAG: GNAT family N-acetyltransferase [Devosia sp.]|nr:GNAT family N-acetyltransferase [Devosia sp.]